MTIDHIEVWHLIVAVIGQVGLFILSIAAFLSRRHNRLYDLITEGDQKAREAAHDQIEAVSKNVKAIEHRVGELEKEVAAMPTRDQLDQNFEALRQAIQQHTDALTTRIDRVIVGQWPPGPGE